MTTLFTTLFLMMLRFFLLQFYTISSYRVSTIKKIYIIRCYYQKKLFHIAFLPKIILEKMVLILIPKYLIKTERTGKFEDSKIKTCKNSVC